MSLVMSGGCDNGTDATGVVPPLGAVGIRGWLSGIYSKLSSSLTVTFAAAQHVIVDSAPTTPVTGTFFQATQPVSLATNTPDITDRAARVLGIVTQQPVTKGTQGTNGVTTQDLKDAGRTPVVLSVTAVASVASEAMFTLNIWKPSGVTTGTSYTVTAGKTFRIQAIQFGCRFATPSTTVTFASCRFNVRSGSLITSPLVYGDSKMAASNAPVPNSDLAIPDGLELAAGSVIGVSHVDSAATLLLDLLISGYEY